MKTIQLVMGSLCLAAVSSLAQTTVFTYQGRLHQAGQPANGAFDLRFQLYADAESKTNLTGPLLLTNIPVADGLFAVGLDFGASVFTNVDLWLQIGVRTNGGVPAFSYLDPRQRLTSAPWAIRAGEAGQAGVAQSVVPGSIAAAALAPGAVTASKLASGAVISDAISGLAITAGKIAPGAVQGSHLAPGAVGSLHLAPDAVDTAALVNRAVTGNKIAFDAVDGTHIAPESVGQSDLVDRAVTSPKIALRAVNETHLAIDAVQSEHLAAAAVQSEHIAPGAIHMTHLGSDVVFTNGGGTNTSLPRGTIILNEEPNLHLAGWTMVAAAEGFGDAWQILPVVPGQGTRNMESHVWTGTELICWGGRMTGGDTSVNTGYRFNPITGVVHSITTNGAPSPRDSAPAVWTGTEMMIFGGVLGATVTNDAALYNPATDTWRPCSKVNAPSRPGSIAVWTGNRALFYQSSAGTNTVFGGLYNPATDTWTTMSTNGAPSSRSYPEYVWTGTELIVWGGATNVQYADTLGDGARYRVSDNTWRPVSLVNAPSARYACASVWTGTEMVIWGGVRMGGGYLGDGACYNPSTDSWRSMSQVGAPERRSVNPVVWTGSTVIIWGGKVDVPDDKVRTRSGGQYNPVTDTWLPTPQRGAPTADVDAAYWTGSKMYLWCSFDEGALYDPTKGLLYLHRWH